MILIPPRHGTSGVGTHPSIRGIQWHVVGSWRYPSYWNFVLLITGREAKVMLSQVYVSSNRELCILAGPGVGWGLPFGGGGESALQQGSASGGSAFQGSAYEEGGCLQGRNYASRQHPTPRLLGKSLFSFVYVRYLLRY